MFKFILFLLVFISAQNETTGESIYKWITNANSTTLVLRPPYPNVEVPFNSIKVVQILNIDGDGRSVSTSNTLLLVGHELYRLTESTLQSIAVFNDADDRSSTDANMSAIIDIKACQWGEKAIIVVNLKTTFNVYILSISDDGKLDKMNALIPIQKLPKHGHHHIISFVQYDGRIYCLLGSTHLDENRSELRILQWRLSFFQIIETIMNKNHKIDAIHVDAARNMFIIVDNAVSQAHDTVVHIYRYQHTNNTSNDEITDDLDLDIKRTQMISTPYNLQNGTMFFYDGYGEYHLFMVFCEGNALHAMSTKRCEYFLWKTDGIDDTIAFQTISDFQLIEGISLESYQQLLAPNNKKIVTAYNVLAFQVNEYFVVVDDKSNQHPPNGIQKHQLYTIPCKNNQLVDAVIIKTRSNIANRFMLKLLFVHVCLRADGCDGPTFTITSHPLFEEQTIGVPKVSDIKPLDKINLSKDKISGELHRIEAILADLKTHLVSHQEEYLKPMKEKANNLHTMLSIFERLNEGIKIAGVLNARKVQLVHVSNRLNVVVLIDQNTNTTQTGNISALYKKLKDINEEIRSTTSNKAISKRSTKLTEHWTGDFMHVKRIYVNGRHPFEDAVKRSFETIVLNGKIKTSNLGVARVAQTVDELKNRIKRDTQSISHSSVTISSINNIVWNDFVSSIYRIGSTRKINGNVVVAGSVTTSSLVTNEINRLPTSELLTISTDQKITANTMISRIIAQHDITSKLFNNMKRFADNVVLLGRDNIVDSHVSIRVFNVSEHLKLADDESDTLTHHIIGTNMDDLTQIYNGHVIIRGSATFDNAFVSSTSDNLFMQPIHNSNKESTPKMNEAIVQVNGVLFRLPHVAHEFWMKSVDQHFGNIEFIKAITTSRLSADSLNGYAGNDYFILNQQFLASKSAQSRLSVVMNNVNVRGSLNTNQNVTTALQTLSSEAIRHLDGSVVTIHSSAIFRDRLIVDHLETRIDTNDFVQRNLSSDATIVNNDSNGLFDKRCRKHFDNKLLVDKNVVLMSAGAGAGDVTIQKFNQFDDLIKSLDSIVSFDRHHQVQDTVVFNGKLGAGQMAVNNFVDIPHRNADLNGFLSDVLQLRGNRVRSISINGDATFLANLTDFDGLNVKMLNDFNVSKHFSGVILKNVDVNAEPVEIHGAKTFKSNLNAQSIKGNMINEMINVNKWQTNTLFNQQTPENLLQFVESERLTFGHITAAHLHASTINGVQMRTDQNSTDPSLLIVNGGQPDNEAIRIKSDIAFSNIVRAGVNAYYTTADTKPCDAMALFSDSLQLPQRNWQLLSTSGVCNVFDKARAKHRDSLSHYFEMVVLNNTNQTIDSDVSLKCHANERISFAKINTDKLSGDETPEKKEVLINGINVMKIWNDAIEEKSLLLGDQTHPLVVNGSKQFLSNVVNSAGPLTVITENIPVNTINGINIPEMSRTMIRRTNEIQLRAGTKIVFLELLSSMGLTISHGKTIGDVSVDNICFVDDPNNVNRPGLSVIFDRTSNIKSSRLHANDGINVNYIEKTSLKSFMDSRAILANATSNLHVRPQSIDGTLTFEHLVLSGSGTNVEKINDVLCKNVILKQSDDKQQITSFKEINGNLILNKPCHAWRINDIEIVPTYTKSIFTDQNLAIDGLTVQNPQKVHAKHQVEVVTAINGIRIDDAFDKQVGSSQILSNVSHSNGQRDKYPTIHYIDATDEIEVVVDVATAINISDIANVRRTWLTIDREVTFADESVRCPMQYLIEYSDTPQKQLIVRRGVSNQRLLSIAFQRDLIVEVHTHYPFVSKHSCSSTDFVPSTVYLNHKQILSLPNRIVESLHVFNVHNMFYILLQFYGEGIAIFEQNSDSEWQQTEMMPLISHKQHTVRLAQSKQSIILIDAERQHSSTNDVSSESKVTLYRFDLVRKQFKPFEEFAGDYDIVTNIEIGYDRHCAMRDSDVYLLLGKKGSKFLQFWQIGDGVTSGEKQIIHFNQTIESISTFQEHGLHYVAVILTDGNVKLYQHYPKCMDSKAQISLHTDMWQEVWQTFLGKGKILQPFIWQSIIKLLAIGELKADANNFAKILELHFY